ncbi:hypothetical protein APTSU1_000184100 [Apodemus speciosus]|uniref:Uncharacterized protein n=1 Tax=Apodemus speciosus TaxID=105296 RepID=A0ABQ0EHY7_APOSI
MNDHRSSRGTSFLTWRGSLGENLAVLLDQANEDWQLGLYL